MFPLRFLSPSLARLSSSARMASEKMGNEKASVTHNEELLSPTQTLDYPIKPDLDAIARIDYSGAHEKTDAREIKLVKKLDLWIMPM